MSQKKVKKLILILMKELKDRTKTMPTPSFEEVEKLNMNQFGQENERNLFVMQSILILGIYNEGIKASLRK